MSDKTNEYMLKDKVSEITTDSENLRVANIRLEVQLANAKIRYEMLEEELKVAKNRISELEQTIKAMNWTQVHIGGY